MVYGNSPKIQLIVHCDVISALEKPETDFAQQFDRISRFVAGYNKSTINIITIFM